MHTLRGGRSVLLFAGMGLLFLVLAGCPPPEIRATASLTYAWQFLAVPDGSAAALANPGTATPSFVADIPGEYVVQLVVNDGQANSAPDCSQAGQYGIACEASDGALSSGTQTVRVIVNDVADGGPTPRLELSVDPVESPSLLKIVRVTGMVNATGELRPPRQVTSALIAGLNPATGEQGQTLDVALTGSAAKSYATYGAGIHNWRNLTTAITNCTFASNTASYGGGLYAESAATVANSVFWGDSPTEIGGAGAAVTYSDVQGGYPGEGNIDADPLFVEASAEPGAGSPCIDAGAAASAPAVDIRGAARPQGALADMGAYEFIEETALRAAFHVTPSEGAAPLAVQFTDDSTQGSAPILAWLWVFGDGSAAAGPDPEHVYEAAGTYSATLGVLTADGVDVAYRPEAVTVTAPE